MRRRPDSAMLLERALLAQARELQCPVEIAGSDCVRWASATFTGMRHMLELRATPSPALDGWLAGLPDAEFALRGHLVADLVVRQVRRADDALLVSIEALTVEER